MQTISLEQFKVNTLGNSYGNPVTNTFVGECVSYVRRGWLDMYGINLNSQGNAVNYWGNTAVLQYFDQITDGSKQDGDTLVWGDDAGNWTGKEGHISFWYKGQLLNQNFGGSRKVTLNPFFSPGYLGALRLKNKGELTMAQVDDIYKDFDARNKLEDARYDRINNLIDGLNKKVDLIHNALASDDDTISKAFIALNNTDKRVDKLEGKK